MVDTRKATGEKAGEREGRVGEGERGREGELGRAVGGVEAGGATGELPKSQAEGGRGLQGHQGQAAPSRSGVGTQEFRCNMCGERYPSVAARTEHNQAAHGMTR